VLGSSGPMDDALDTLERGEGVCRDFAHVVVGLCRAAEIPARCVSVYAPGLEPQDFHLVAETWWQGSWRIVDATGLAPVEQMVRICTGRDAADTAWMTTFGPEADLDSVDVHVVRA
jgi:transglutaminase-like putative cysteine protease